MSEAGEFSMNEAELDTLSARRLESAVQVSGIVETAARRIVPPAG
jgi:hypothetical protein